MNQRCFRHNTVDSMRLSLPAYTPRANVNTASNDPRLSWGLFIPPVVGMNTLHYNRLVLYSEVSCAGFLVLFLSRSDTVP